MSFSADKPTAGRAPSEREVLASLKGRLLRAAEYLMPHDVERSGDGAEASYALTLSVRVDARALSGDPPALDLGAILREGGPEEVRTAGFGILAVREGAGPEQDWTYYELGPDGRYQAIGRSAGYDPPYGSATGSGTARAAGGP